MDDAAMIKCPKFKRLIKIQHDGTVYCKLCGYVNKVDYIEKMKK
jgi:uncharacterized Zn finger protein (UPF0148 family)